MTRILPREEYVSRFVPQVATLTREQLEEKFQDAMYKLYLAELDLIYLEEKIANPVAPFEERMGGCFTKQELADVNKW